MAAHALNLDKLRVKSLRLILWMLWFQSVLIFSACLLNHLSIWLPTTVVLMIAGAAELTARLDRSGGHARIVSGVALMATISVLVAVFTGQKLQVDLHMYYFAALALLVTTCDWKVIVAGAATVAVHHTVSNFLIPALVYSGGGDLLRLAIHAVILVLEAAALAWLAFTVQAMFAAVESEASRAEAALVAAEANHGQAIEAAASAETAQRLRAEDQARVAKEDDLTMTGLADALAHLAVGDLTFRLLSPLPDRAERLRQDFNQALDKLQETMLAVSGNASATQESASDIARSASDLSRRTEQQAASLEETAAALDQITATVRRTASGAKHACEVVGQAKQGAEDCNGVMLKAVSAMSEIQASSREISQIIGVIDEIAFQTNLLALNAGVEAARAGDAGRGFAVVAAEVRSLAQRSAEAAKQIKSLITNSAKQVDAGAKLVSGSGQALERIVEEVIEINGIVSEIAASAQEQAGALGQVNSAVNHMDQVTQQNAAMVEQATAAGETLSQETAKLAQLIGSFKVSDADRSPSRAATTRWPAAKRAA